MRIRVMADYEMHPFWEIHEDEPSRNFDPRELPLSPEIVNELEVWAQTYDQTLNQLNPADSGFEPPSFLDEFVEKGRELARRLAKELGSGFSVEYFDEKSKQVVPVERSD